MWNCVKTELPEPTDGYDYTQRLLVAIDVDGIRHIVDDVKFIKNYEDWGETHRTPVFVHHPNCYEYDQKVLENVTHWMYLSTLQLP
jgi:hypothetical protein